MTTPEVKRGILDADLLRHLEKNHVDTLQIRENEREKYEIYAVLKWDSQPLPVMSTRGKPREWVSLDRMVKHLKQESFAVKIDWIMFDPSITKGKPC